MYLINIAEASMSKQYETRMKILAAIEQLLRTRDPDKIRVNDICRLSGVSRTTFYVYFEDIFSAIQWFWDDLCSQTLYRINTELTWEEGHHALLTGLKEHAEFYQKCFVSKDYQSLFAYGYRKSLIHHIENIESTLGRPLTAHELFELDYTVRAFSAITSKWAESGMEPSVGSMTLLLSRFVPPFARLKRTRSHRPADHPDAQDSSPTPDAPDVLPDQGQ